MNAQRIGLIAMLLLPAAASSQTGTPPSSTDSANKQAPATPPFDFSGILFTNYQYRGDRGPAKSSNKFDVERVYLTFQIPAGERVSVRVTTDVYQQTSSGSDSYYKGWAIRAKYAYLQYNWLNNPDWKANARVGLLHTAFIDYDERFWPRWISTTPTDRASYFASSDAGIANTLTFPKKFGEVYTTITNGPGYTSRETDRFKDYAARVSVTPWGSEAGNPFRTLAFTLWGYKGAIASKFVDGGPGQVGRVGSALDRNRWGVHVGRLDPRVTIAGELAWRRDEGETGNNTPSAPRAVVDSTGTIASAYGIVRPFAPEGNKPHPLSLLARYDRVTTNTDSDARYDVLIGGAAWDFSSKASLSLDYQANEPQAGNPIARSHTWFLHFVGRF